MYLILHHRESPDWKYRSILYMNDKPRFLHGYSHDLKSKPYSMRMSTRLDTPARYSWGVSSENVHVPIFEMKLFVSMICKFTKLESQPIDKSVSRRSDLGARAPVVKWNYTNRCQNYRQYAPWTYQNMPKCVLQGLQRAKRVTRHIEYRGIWSVNSPNPCSNKKESLIIGRIAHQ